MFVKKITFLAIKKQPLEKGLSFCIITATALLRALHLIIFFLFNCSQEPNNSTEACQRHDYKKKDIKQTHKLLPPDPYATLYCTIRIHPYASDC